MLIERDGLPAGLLDAEPHALRDLLGGPTLMHLDGRRPEPLFVSVLLHGNETTGFLALRTLLRRYADARETLPRALSLFIGNVTAAVEGLRRLDGQPDYNRVWPGGGDDTTPEHRMMRRVTDIMRAHAPFASIDIHNNTGLNPHYACVNVLDHRFFRLATLFGRTVVYFIRPTGVQSLAFAGFCPAVTLECGQPGQQHGIDHAVEFVNACLHLAEIPDHPVAAHDIDLFHTVATVRVRAGIDFVVGGGEAALRLAGDIDHLNFRELPAGTALGWVDGEALPLAVVDENGADVGARYFEVANGSLRLAQPVMPSMLSTDPGIIRQDCLGYLMERYPLPGC